MRCGCHVWSVNGDTFKASQSVTLRRGAVLSLVNRDVMPHTFILKSGPSVTISHPTLAEIGASLTVQLTKPGTYHFATKAGEDYRNAGDVKTIGADSVLRLTVVVHRLEPPTREVERAGLAGPFCARCGFTAHRFRGSADAASPAGADHSPHENELRRRLAGR